MLFVYGSLMPLRILEEIRFWKTQEKEHTLVIRTLVPSLEPQYVKTLQEWEAVFEKTEMSSQQWIEWAVRSQMPADPFLNQQIHVLLESSKTQSADFIRQLMEMEQNSMPVRSNPVVKIVIEHIIRESEYFLGALQALESTYPSAAAQQGYPFSMPTSAQPSYPFLAEQPFARSELSGNSSLAPDSNLTLESVRISSDGSIPRELGATGESSWSSITQGLQGSQEPLSRQPIPIGGHRLPPLPYPYDALEPHIDAATMKLHHDKHHQSYVDGLNKAEKMLEKARTGGDFELVKHWERELAFNGAGHFLHTIFWNVMSPKGGGPATGPIVDELRQSFGSFDRFKKHFSSSAEKVEGGGWTILVWSPRSHRLEILQAEKHQNLSQWDVIPLLPLDVWEHAYYLKYANERAKYIDAWWKVVNWNHVNERFHLAKTLLWTPY